MHKLGVLLEGGHGVAKDVAEAVTWYRRAAAQGNAGVRSLARKALQRLGRR